MLRGRIFPLIVLCACLFNCLYSAKADTWPPKYNWATGDFQKPDANYTSIRNRIVNEFKTAVEPNQFYVKYQNKLNNKDPKTYFAWGYAAFLTHAYGGSTKDGVVAIDAFLRKTEDMSLPGNYEFQRIRFLVAERYSYMPERLLPLTLRLLEQVPKDYEVQVARGRILTRLPGKDEKLKAVAYANALTKQYPNERGCYFLQGDAYSALARVAKDKDANTKAIQAYEKYISLTPNTSRYAQSRRNAEILIRLAKRRF